jgi:two-component sensor histidine kinase
MADPSPVDVHILEMLPVGIFAIDRNWSITLWNRTLASWTGIGAAAALGRRLEEVLPSFADRRYSARLGLLLEGGPPVVFSYQLHPDLFPDAHRRGLRRARYCTASPMAGDGGILFAVEDRTEIAALALASREELLLRRGIEEELRRAIEVKEMLIREASHRVKNNLMMIASLISLEAERVEDGSLAGFLKDLEARIGSIGLIHQFLYRGEIGADVRLDEYLDRLCATIVGTFPVKGRGARLALDLEALTLDMDATPYLGMMTAELVTNSLKYGPVPGKELVISVSLRKDRNSGDLELRVEDSGPGFPEGTVPDSNSLGWGLLELFVEQLGGSVTILPKAGACVLIRIPGHGKMVETVSPKGLA